MLKAATAIYVVGFGVAEAELYVDGQKRHPMFGGFFLELSFPRRPDAEFMFHHADNETVEIDGTIMRLMETDEKTIIELQLLVPGDVENRVVTSIRNVFEEGLWDETDKEFMAACDRLIKHSNPPTQ